MYSACGRAEGEPLTRAEFIDMMDNEDVRVVIQNMARTIEDKLAAASHAAVSAALPRARMDAIGLKI